MATSAHALTAPRWAVLLLAVLLAVAICAIVLNAVVVFALISRVNHTHVLICHLYARERQPLPPGC